MCSQHTASRNIKLAQTQLSQGTNSHLGPGGTSEIHFLCPEKFMLGQYRIRTKEPSICRQKRYHWTNAPHTQKVLTSTEARKTNHFWFRYGLKANINGQINKVSKAFIAHELYWHVTSKQKDLFATINNHEHCNIVYTWSSHLHIYISGLRKLSQRSVHLTGYPG